MIGRCSTRLDRPVLKVEGGTSVQGRVGLKKDFDKEVFGTKYF